MSLSSLKGRRAASKGQELGEKQERYAKAVEIPKELQSWCRDPLVQAVGRGRWRLAIARHRIEDKNEKETEDSVSRLLFRPWTEVPHLLHN